MQLTRRSALQGMALASALSALGPARAGTIDGRPRLLVVHLRGGLDALASLPPVGDPHFAAARGTLAPTETPAGGGPVALDGLFSLHHALAPLLPAFTVGQLAVIPATGIPAVDASHACAEAALFDGAIDGGGTGWLERAAEALPGGAGTVWRQPSTDRSIDTLADLLLGNPLFDMDCLLDGSGMHCVGDLLAHRGAAEASRFAIAAADAARALSTEDGPRIATIELSGFDTHVAQGTEGGRLARVLAALADGLVGFAATSGPAWQQTAVLVVTEFGRSIAPNKNVGTDHGDASLTMLMGSAVAGGRVGSRWPGLGQNASRSGLAATTDTRSVIKAVLSQHLRLSGRKVAQILPSAAAVPAMPDLFRA